MATTNIIAPLAITALLSIDSDCKPSRTTPWTYRKDYLSDCTNKVYVFLARSYTIDSRTTDDDYDDTYEDDDCGCSDDPVNT